MCLNPKDFIQYSDSDGKRRLCSTTSKKAIIFANRDDSERLTLPCGKCLECKRAYSQMWGVRAVCEAMMHDKSCFVTLTYDSEHLPFSRDANPTLRKDDFQKFMKRLRISLNDNRIRFFACGEYGSEGLRPHYHAILYGVDFERVPTVTHDGRTIYSCPELSKFWPFGFVSIGDVSVQSCMYVARYATKKFGEKPPVGNVQPPFMLQSRRPGLGSDFCEKYLRSVCSAESVVLGNGKFSLPRYFLEKIRLTDMVKYEIIRANRRLMASRDSVPTDADLADVFASLEAIRQEQLRKEMLLCHKLTAKRSKL